ncbi:Uncharacterized conserved protein, DUF885 familyt [Fontimonas thermophila]|uniref:Uncharacterized conserved protein, DUF885 familyt n=1 Tax=Fontimonas thermophila TaxID=1076937 RepID=A0A1I2HJ94_9GAMM|nr:DUF885 domain-containing protein [Fontimonas thermophila]SFF30375.1 Uncharacterized conserved protein, DUF885 familyt [Fontimonas thermophila]
MRPVLALLSVLVLSWSTGVAGAPAWVEESDRNAAVLLDVMAQFAPETAGQIGVDGYDEKVLDLGPEVYERSQAATQAAIATLEQRRALTTDTAVLEDLDILLQAARDSLASQRLEHELMLPYYNVPQTVFVGIKALLDPRVPKTRQQAAVKRLQAYAGMAEGAQPITELAKARTMERMGDERLLGPYRGEVEQDLADAPRYVDGIAKLFADAGLSGYEPALKVLRKQIADYQKWVRKTVLPRARTDHRLPPQLYADRLKQYGVDVAPDELIRRALLSFAEIRNEMQALAPLLARQIGLDATDYRDVIRVLKKAQVQGAQILPLYESRLAAIEKLVQMHDVVTLPQRKAVIRLASEAESAMIPAPFMSPPRLIGNTGEYGEFVLPLHVPGKAGRADLKTDDFTFDAAAWTLSAHEARPGHEMQFAAMIEKGVSIARAVFAFNSVNVEGWALYAEAEMKPLFPLEGQLIGLQHRMMRAARAFLDPMVNLGQITPEQARAFLEREVVLSPGMAQQEVDRYTFRAPGQATSYFVGYQALMALRQRTELALGTRFDRRRFHDFVLAQGLLPPRLLERAVFERFVPAELGGEKTGLPDPAAQPPR